MKIAYFHWNVVCKFANQTHKARPAERQNVTCLIAVKICWDHVIYYATDSVHYMYISTLAEKDSHSWHGARYHGRHGERRLCAYQIAEDAISMFSVSQGSAETPIRRRGNFCHLSIACFLWNVCAGTDETPASHTRLTARNAGNHSICRFVLCSAICSLNIHYRTTHCNSWV